MFVSRRFIRNFTTLSSYLSKKDWIGAVSYLERPSTTDPIDPEALDLLMGKLYSNNKHNEAYKLLLLLPSLGKDPTELDYTLAIEVCLQQSKVVQALNIFYQSQLFGVSLDSCLYSNLISACTKEIGARNIKWILTCMNRDQATLSIHSCVSAIKIGIMIKDYSLIETLIIMMHQAKYEMPNKMINNFVSRTSSDSAEYKSLKTAWQNIQQNSFIDHIDKEKPFDIQLKNLKTDSKTPLSFELIVLPREQTELLDSSPDEESSSD